MTTPRGTEKAEVVILVKTTSVVGDGTEKDPCRYIYQYWDFDGNKVAEHDDWKENRAISSL